MYTKRDRPGRVKRMANLKTLKDKYVEAIRRKRLQLIIHSFIYYELNDNIWPDDKWQAVADELTTLQKEYPHNIGLYDVEFKGWSGSTGFHLCRIAEMRHKAESILKYHKERKA